ncbi:MAG: hypothetical protein H7326_04105 [Bdellovibrionaceae bacterium]|nr:hypothetical protein [Pseudobdellovibrionaceae bacterium]
MKQFILILLSSLLAASSAHAGRFGRGWDNGNAGDAYVSEFILSGRDVLQRLELVFEKDKKAFDTSKLRAAIASTEVVSEEHVYLDGHERDAVNYYPNENLIKVNRSRWRELRRSTETKARLRLVLHEYMWISGVDDTNFHESERLIELLNIGNYSPSTWWNPVNPINYVATTLSFAPEGCTFTSGKFDVNKSEETVVLETAGDCKDAYRKIEFVKSTGVTPASSNVRGLFHSYQIKVYDNNQTIKGEMTFEPEWGACLVPESGSCRGSGKMTLGGVEIFFWFLRD